MAEILIIDEASLPAFADRIADMVIRSMSNKLKEKQDPDPLMDPIQLEVIFPTLKASTIRGQIRKGEYGKKMGGKGKLVARPSEVRKHHRL